MKLVKARVENFKCVEDSEEFDVDQVTCLVGKNEAGKTALLQALYRLKPLDDDKAAFDEKDYPRRDLSTSRQREERESANVLTTTWDLDDSDVDFLEGKTASGAIKGRRIVVEKGYDQTCKWFLTLDGEALVDEKAIVDDLIGDTRFDAIEKGQIGAPTSVDQLREALERGKAPTDKMTAVLEDLKSRFPKGLSNLVNTALGQRLPTIVYFDVYDSLPGRVSLHDLKQRKADKKLTFNDEIFLALLDMASTSLDELEDLSDLERLIMELEAVEASLTDTIKRYWTQNRHLEVQFRKDVVKRDDLPPTNQDFVISTRVFNTRHRASVNFDERSAGFIWFFSFLVWFSQVKGNYGNNVVLLLDDPGLSLHGKAQQDLIRYINKELRPNHQVLYTSHSPFMIDVDHIFSLRSVEDVVTIRDEDGDPVEEIHGTKVGQRILSRDKDTLFPLQGVLGFDMAQTLFVGPYVIVVEGPTERVYFDWFARELAKRNRDALDVRWAICPAEGAGKISSFVTLFAGRELKIAVFTDYHQEQKGVIDRLEESGLLEPGHLLKTSGYVDQDEADIEDVLGRELYVYLVNGALELRDQYRLLDTRPDDAPDRVVKEVEARCRLLPPGFPDFDHYKPAEYLQGLSSAEVDALPGLDEALERFEAAFRDLNKLIPKAGPD